MFSLLPSAGQFVSGQNLRGAAYACAFVGCLYKALNARLDHNDYKDTYENQREAYQTAENSDDPKSIFTQMTQTYKKMNNAEDDLNLFLLLTVGVYAVQLADAWIWGGGARPTAQSGKYNHKKFKAQSFIHVGRDDVRVGIGFWFGGGR